MTFDKAALAEQAAQLHEKIEAASTIGISGHINPDGDCVGSCLGLCTYIRENYPDKQVDVYLEPIGAKFRFLKYADTIRQEKSGGEIYDLYFSLDCSEPSRLGPFAAYFEEAKDTVCVDHHITNSNFGNLCCIYPDAAATCEILYELLDLGRMSKACAEAVYVGIVHDTGVFKHSNTTRHVMEAAGVLLEKGVRSDEIIDDTFYRKTYIQNQILGRALMESILLLDGRIIYSVLTRKDLDLYQVDSNDLDGIIDQLRVTEGVECALFLYEKKVGQYKVSMRSNGRVDVSSIAMALGGGGHKMAAGCTVEGQARDIVNHVSGLVEDQLKKAGVIE